MKKISSQTTDEYDNVSGTNPSLITAGLPSGSMITSHLIQSSPKTKQNHHINQNHATDTQPIITLSSQENDNSQHTIISDRVISDTYLNLSRKDMNDVMVALQTLAQCITNEYTMPMDDSRSHHLSMLYSKSTNHTLKSSTPTNSSSHHCFYSRRCRRNSHYRHHHVKYHRNLVDDFQDDLYHMKCKKQHRFLHQLQYDKKYLSHHNPSRYPSYSSNAIFYTSACRSNKQARQVYHCSQQHQSRINIHSENPYQQSIKTKLSPYILDNHVYIDKKESISNIKILPQQAHNFQILQKNRINGVTSTDSLTTKDIFIPLLTQRYVQKLNHDQTSGMGDQLNLNKIDVATQWSLQMLSSLKRNPSKSDRSSKIHDEQEHSKLNLSSKNSTTLTELSQSVATIATNHSVDKIPSIVKTGSFVNNSSLTTDPFDIKINRNTKEIDLEKLSLNINDEYELTKSQTERFLTKLSIKTCKCSTTKLQTVKSSPVDDSITCISFDNDSSACLSSNKNETTQKSIKRIVTFSQAASKRLRQHTSKSSKNNATIKRSRTYRRSQSNNQPIRIIKSSKTTNLKKDSFFDFFDIDTTFSDTYDRLFTDTAT
ncbi:unnamed protein product [Rotaria socialis]|uniref:Uncharacterized protein n=1 Tax=Rotaria socialis TaxID=392032 RepID=A0A818B4F1_9BILA|nr:unnamed protein product [Rotaria socialis]CAF3407671.1 unnamed protein product [Rotaria socialis]CAF3415445.1 unnamed protein product [Rotaria socialis]CAF4276728.1 unnamed protein product [Rotaria socialis]CAF4421964.1 unnamed protein product [Rotaria socialis]